MNAYTLQGNLLISEDGVAHLADFGISVIMTDPNVITHSRTTTAKQELTRYMAPEQISPEQFGRKHGDPPSKESDVHSLAMTMYEVRFLTPHFCTAENFRPPPGFHGNQTVRWEKRPQYHKAHYNWHPSALSNARGSRSFVTRPNLGDDGFLLGDGAIVTVGH